MKVYTARQAILNRRQQTVAYELFFRDGIENAFPRHVKPDVATSRLVLNQHLNIGFKNLCRNKMALVKAYESGSWFWTQKHSNALKLEENILPDLYSQAVQWSEDFEANTSGK